MIGELVITIIIVSFSIYILYRDLKKSSKNKCDGSCCNCPYNNSKCSKKTFRI